MNFGVTVLNSPGTIDRGYRGKVNVVLIHHGKEVFKINKGDRIAQIVFVNLSDIETMVTKNVTIKDTDRKDRGFGSSGSK